MTKATEKIYNKLAAGIADESQKLGGSDYYDLLDELSGHIGMLQLAYREEHPEDFS